MAREVRDYAGGAVDTTLSASINSTDLSISIADATGWPTGGANGPFFIVVSYDVTGKEKIEVASRTGTTLTVASTGKRGIDGTSAASHASAAKVRHCITAQDHDEFNSHAFDTTQDDHTQYLNTARHDVTGRHTVGSVVPAGTPGTIAPDDTASAGAANSVARSDHRHGITAAVAGTIEPDDTAAEGVASSFARSDHKHAVVAAAPVNVGTANAEGTATSFARSDHVHNLATGAVNTTAKIVDGIVTLAKMASEAGTDYGPTMTLTGVTLGTGGSKYARYWKLGRLVVMLMGFELGTGGDVTATIQFSLPFTPVNIAGFGGSNAGGGFTAASARDSSTAQRSSGIGAVRVDLLTATDFVITGASTGWNASTPFNWASGDTMEAIVVFEATA